ncbi:MAG: O-antigen ligase family protein [Bryobacteraceae bacterium]
MTRELIQMSSSLTPSANKPAVSGIGALKPSVAGSSSVNPLGSNASGRENWMSPAPTAPELHRHNWQERALGFAPILLATYVFFLFSRIFEASLLFGFGNLYLMMVISAVGLLVIFLGGDFLRAAGTPAGLIFLVFTFWAVVIMPFSSWHSESLEVFGNIWLKSVAAFFIIAGLSRSFDHTRKVFMFLGIGAVVSLVVVILSGHLAGDRFESFGSMANANEVAFHLMLGLPFIAYVIGRSKVVWKIPLAAAFLGSIVYSLKTVSRAGIIIAVVLFVIAFVQVSFANKIKLLCIGAAGAAIGLLLLDQASVSRYLTILNPDSVSDEAARSARESADTRKYKLEQGIELTYMHPIAGVGMGDFIPASAELSTSKGEKPIWIASHNSYVQVSSETGIPGFGLFCTVFAICYIQLIRLGKTARRLRLEELRSMSVCALLALVALSIHFFFDAIAWDYYFPMIAGLSMALVYTSRPLIAKAEAEALGGTETPALETAAGTSTQGWLRPSFTVPSKTSQPQPRNPYRLGRRRGIGSRQ